MINKIKKKKKQRLPELKKRVKAWKKKHQQIQSRHSYTHVGQSKLLRLRVLLGIEIINIVNAHYHEVCICKFAYSLNFILTLK